MERKIFIPTQKEYNVYYNFIEKYLDKKYLNAGGRVSGYITGLQLANQYGFTTQNPSCYEICSNEATTKQRKQDLTMLCSYPEQMPLLSMQIKQP